MGRSKKPIPTDDEIMSFQNVPCDVAARYIGWSSSAVRAALKVGSVPFGCASQPTDNEWSFHIVPALLVKYENGELPAYRLGTLQKLIAEGVETLLNEKMEGLRKVLNAIAA